MLGRDALVLRNGSYENLARKQLVILQFDKPRFPEVDANGLLDVPVRIWHHHSSAVQITRIRVLRFPREASPGAGGPAPTESDLAVGSLLPVPSIPPAGVSIRLQLDTRTEPNVSYILYRLSGVTDDGYSVTGEVSVMRPTDLPTRETSDPVTDPALMAKIIQAQKILGKQYVTDEDIWRLQREGKLDEHVPSSQLPLKATDEPVGPKPESR